MKVIFRVPRIRKRIIEEIEGTGEKRLSKVSSVEYPNYVFSAAFNGRLLAIGGRSGRIRVFNLLNPREPKRVYEILAHGGSVMDLLRLDDLLLSCSRDATIKARRGKEEVFTLRGHRQCVRSIAYRNGYLVSVSMDGLVKLWDFERRKELKTIDENKARVVHVRNHKDFFVWVTIDGHVKARSLKEEKLLWDQYIGLSALGVAINRPYIAVSTLVGITIFNASGERVMDIPVPTRDSKIRRPEYIGDSIAIGGDLLRVIDDPLGEPEIRSINGHKDRIYSVVHQEGLTFTCSLDHTAGIRFQNVIKRKKHVEKESSERVLAFECENPGDGKPEEWLIEAFRYRPVYVLKKACGKCLKTLLEELKSRGLVKESSDGYLSLVPPEDPTGLRRGFSEYLMYTMHLEKRYFDLIASGKKRIEGRIVKPERENMKPGDIIEFYDDSGRRIRCRVKDVRFYESLEEMVKREGYKNLIPDAESEDEVIAVYRSFYPQGGRFMAIELEGCERVSRYSRSHHLFRRTLDA